MLIETKQQISISFLSLRGSLYQRVLKVLLLGLFSILVVTAQGQIEHDIPPVPNPPRLVNDFSGGFLTPEQRDALERKLVTYDDSTSNQIAIVVVNDLKGYSKDEFAIALGKKWGVGGQKQFSNGVVILVKPKTQSSKGEVFIASGYGLEGSVTDLVADQIIQTDLIPNFKQESKTYNYRGLDEATTAIMDAAAGKYQAPDGYDQRGKGGGRLSGLLMAAIILFIIIVIISRRGGGGGGYVSRRGYRDNWGGPVIFPGGWSGGGDSGGGGWSGGGGGFGGFGGGGFGGGGAGGSW